MEIPKELNNEIWEYCRVNKITDIDGFINKMVKQGFTVEKYGATPYTTEGEIKEVEVVKEVPVEVIKEVRVEVIKEVPVDKIKEVYITDDKQVKEMTEELERMKEQLGLTTEEFEKKFENQINEIKRLEIANSLMDGYVEKLEQLEKELKEERAKKDKPDIYKEGMGFFGSDTRDLQP